VRANKLQNEYQVKARATDRHQGVPAGTVGRLEAKLVSFGEVEGIVAGQFWEMRGHAPSGGCPDHQPGPGGRQRRLRSEEAKRAMAVSGLRRRLGVMAVRCQASSLLDWLETLGPLDIAAALGRKKSGDLEWIWQRGRPRKTSSLQGRNEDPVRQLCKILKNFRNFFLSLYTFFTSFMYSCILSEKKKSNTIHIHIRITKNVVIFWQVVEELTGRSIDSRFRLECFNTFCILQV
jgi:hypothetical protein